MWKEIILSYSKSLARHRQEGLRKITNIGAKIRKVSYKSIHYNFYASAYFLSHKLLFKSFK
jgi:hypothetical protein